MLKNFYLNIIRENLIQIQNDINKGKSLNNKLMTKYLQTGGDAQRSRNKIARIFRDKNPTDIEILNAIRILNGRPGETNLDITNEVQRNFNINNIRQRIGSLTTDIQEREPLTQPLNDQRINELLDSYTDDIVEKEEQESSLRPFLELQMAEQNTPSQVDVSGQVAPAPSQVDVSGQITPAPGQVAPAPSQVDVPGQITPAPSQVDVSNEDFNSLRESINRNLRLLIESTQGLRGMVDQFNNDIDRLNKLGKEINDQMTRFVNLSDTRYNTLVAERDQIQNQLTIVTSERDECNEKILRINGVIDRLIREVRDLCERNESITKELNELRTSLGQNGGNIWETKYLKYKNKYLALKKLSR